MTAKGWRARRVRPGRAQPRPSTCSASTSSSCSRRSPPTQFGRSDDLDLLYGGTGPQPGHGRLLRRRRPAGRGGVGAAGRPRAAARRRVDEAIDAGLRRGARAVRPPPRTSPTHPDYDRVWAALAERRRAVHAPHRRRRRARAPARSTTTAAPVTDFLGGGENIRSKDYMGMHHSARAVPVGMVLDGVFERFPALRGGCIEQGAMWVVAVAAAARHRAGARSSRPSRRWTLPLRRPSTCTASCGSRRSRPSPSAG